MCVSLAQVATLQHEHLGLLSFLSRLTLRAGAAAQALAGALRSHGRLRDLSLSDNSFGDEGAEARELALTGPARLQTFVEQHPSASACGTQKGLSTLKKWVQALGAALGSCLLLQEGVWQKVSATDLPGLPSFEGCKRGDSCQERSAAAPQNRKLATTEQPVRS